MSDEWNKKWAASNRKLWWTVAAIAVGLWLLVRVLSYFSP